MSWLLCNHHNFRNLGDQLTSPALYDERFAALDWCDIEALPSCNLARYDGVIFGGGGMLYGESAKRMASVVKRMPVIVMGVGINEAFDASVAWPEWLKDCVLAGLRDWGSPYEWCPCFSCLHDVFDKALAEASEVASGLLRWYGHEATMGKCDVPFRLSNNRHVLELALVLDYIGGAKTLYTDSYHGAIWANWLNVPVILTEPASNKFKCLPPANVGLEATRKAARACLDKVAKHIGL